MARLPLVLLHGYSDGGASWARWRELLVREGGYRADEIHAIDYVSLADELTIKDLAEGFERALRIHDVLRSTEAFDAIVHSTGGLVLRQWLASRPDRRRRVKRLVGLAPAMFGSPLAHKGRSWIGGVIKGSRRRGPDFLEAGDRILAGLELGSRFTWDLAHLDLVGSEEAYGEHGDTPYPFVIVGDEGYDGLRGLVNEAGTDGTVRWAGASLTTRKLVVDLTHERVVAGPARVTAPARASVNVPFALVPGHNHGSILREPQPELRQLVLAALQVEDLARYREWDERHGWSPAPHAGPVTGGDEPHPLRDWLARLLGAATGKPHLWQQFVVRALDERGDPVPDWYMELGTGDGSGFEPLDDFALDVHPFRDDPSLRCFHVDLTELAAKHPESLSLRLTAITGSELVGYRGAGAERFDPRRAGEDAELPVWDACIALPAAAPEVELLPGANGEEARATGETVRFFYPYTTTLVELRLNREPMPPDGVNRVLRFLADG
jgi:hypothetical protein